MFAIACYVRPQVAAGGRRMGMLMIRCPKTGRAIHTGKKVERTAFRATPVFFSQTYCPLCRATHEWFVKDAWVCDSDCSECEARCERQVAQLITLSSCAGTDHPRNLRFAENA